MPGYSRLGTDLTLVPAGREGEEGPLPFPDSWGSLDLAIGPRRTPRVRDGGGDLQPIAGRENLAQALVLRLLTPVGALAHLGHSAYGSRLTSLIGRPDDAATRNLARRYVIEALAAEPRIAQPVDALDVQSVPGDPASLQVAFSVRPITDEDPLSIVLEVAL